MVVAALNCRMHTQQLGMHREKCTMCDQNSVYVLKLGVNNTRLSVS